MAKFIRPDSDPIPILFSDHAAKVVEFVFSTAATGAIIQTQLAGRPYLDFFEQLGHLVEVESRVNGTVHTLHGQRLVGSQRIQVGKVRFCREGGEVGGAFRGRAKPELG